MALPASHSLAKRAVTKDSTLPRQYLHGLPEFKTYGKPGNIVDGELDPHDPSFDVGNGNSNIDTANDVSSNPYAGFQPVGYTPSQPANDGISNNQIKPYSNSDSSTTRSTRGMMNDISVSDIDYRHRADVNDLLQGGDRNLLNLLPEDLVPYRPVKGKRVIA